MEDDGQINPSKMIAHFGIHGRVLDQEERKRIADRRGVCFRCSKPTHDRIIFSLWKKPISNGIVCNGICISCKPSDAPLHKPKSSVTNNRPQPLANIAPLDQPNAAVTTENPGRRSQQDGQHETMEKIVEELLRPLKNAGNDVYEAYTRLLYCSDTITVEGLEEWAAKVYKGGNKREDVNRWRKTLVSWLYEVVEKWKKADESGAGLEFADKVKEKLGNQFPAVLRMCLVLDRANALYNLQVNPCVSPRGMDFYCQLHVQPQNSSLFLPWMESEQEQLTWIDIHGWWRDNREGFTPPMNKNLFLLVFHKHWKYCEGHREIKKWARPTPSPQRPDGAP